MKSQESQRIVASDGIPAIMPLVRHARGSFVDSVPDVVHIEIIAHECKRPISAEEDRFAQAGAGQPTKNSMKEINPMLFEVVVNSAVVSHIDIKTGSLASHGDNVSQAEPLTG